MNNISLSGRLTHDPELKSTQNGNSVCSFSVAVQRPGTKDKTDFITCVAWRQKAEFVSSYFKKGSRIEVAGVLVSRKWEDKDFNKRTSMEVLCNDISFGESKKQEAYSYEPSQQSSFEEITTDDDMPF